MTPMKKKILFVFMILGFGLFFNALCFQLCLSDQQVLDLIQYGNCPISSNSFAHAGNGLSGLFLLPLVGLFLLRTFLLVPEGFVLLPFRPPRLQY